MSYCSVVVLAVITNQAKNEAMKIIYHFFGKNIFDHIIGVDDNTPPKPDPKGVLYIIDSLNLNSQECILVGDSEGDYQTAKNAGVKAIAAAWGFRDKEILLSSKADMVIEKPCDLLKLFTFEPF